MAQGTVPLGQPVTPAVFRARATSLLVAGAGTEAGELVSAVVVWVRRQLVAEEQCAYRGCSAPATRQPLDAGPGGMCDAHVDEPAEWYAHIYEPDGSITVRPIRSRVSPEEFFANTRRRRIRGHEHAD